MNDLPQSSVLDSERLGLVRLMALITVAGSNESPRFILPIHLIRGSRRTRG